MGAVCVYNGGLGVIVQGGTLKPVLGPAIIQTRSAGPNLKKKKKFILVRKNCFEQISYLQKLPDPNSLMCFERGHDKKNMF